LTLVWETPELALDLIEEFLTGVRRTAQPSRVLATVLFTDIVGSTEQASRLGDRRWRELLNVHDERAQRLVEDFGGQLVKTTGDGILATFDGPGRGIRCAAAFRDELRNIGPEIRAGCTPARSNYGTGISAASRSISVPGCWLPPSPVRSSPLGPCGTWSSDPTSPWPTAAGGP
jgi:class 3 adenylate cyclase